MLSLLSAGAYAAIPAGAGNDRKLVAHIPVEVLGFVPPPRYFMPYRVPSATLDFLDDSHLLFTFHAAKLMHREIDDPKEDDDQTVRALVLSLPDGKVTAEGTWRMHDRGRYLWVLGGGRFLMRQRDTLFIGDEKLTLVTYLHPEGTFVSAQLSPNAKDLLVEFANPAQAEEEEGDGRPAGAPTLGPSLSGGSSSTTTAAEDLAALARKRKQYTLLRVEVEKHTASRLGVLRQPLLFPLMSNGYLGVLPATKGKEWNVILATFGGTQQTIASVTSSCQPSVTPLSEQTFLAQTCVPYISDHLMQAFDLHGHKLWEQMWQSRFTWGSFAYSKAGNRFAYGSVEVNHSLAPLDPVDESSILGQPIGVFNIASGKLDTVIEANPILTFGENYALSPDGDMLAVLREGAIELYSLPPVAPPAPLPEAGKSQ